MQRISADLSTLMGAAILLGAVIGLCIGKITAEVFLMIAPSAALLIGVPQRAPITNLNAETAVVTPPVVVNTVVPTTKDPVC